MFSMVAQPESGSILAGCCSDGSLRCEVSTIYKSLIVKPLKTCFRTLSKKNSTSDAAGHLWRQKELG